MLANRDDPSRPPPICTASAGPSRRTQERSALSPDGSTPSSDYPVKVNLGAKRHYTEDSPFYARTAAQVWFRSAEDAESAGFARSG